MLSLFAVACMSTAVRAEPAFPEHDLSVDSGETKAAQRVLTQIDQLRDAVVETKYQHRTKVRVRDGYYAWDCSGMANWILRKASPKAYRALRAERPKAKNFYKTISAAPTDRAQRGWQRLGGIADARPGDLFAWQRTETASAHVGFIIDTPHPSETVDGGWVVRITDATAQPHLDDARRESPDGGFGFGTMMFVTDEDGNTEFYGWHGERSRLNPTPVVFGRVSK